MINNQNFIDSSDVETKNRVNTTYFDNSLSNFSLLNNMDPETKLIYYFKNLKIYIEIFNDNLNCSDIYFTKLERYKILKCRKLCKSINYIIFKDGHLKTKKYAYNNNIKIVNPLWVDDKISKNLFKDDKFYEININYNNILLTERINKYEKEEKKNLSNNKNNKIFDVELEAEYDSAYANYIDSLRSNPNSNIVNIAHNLNSDTNNDPSFKIEDFFNFDNESLVTRQKRTSLPHKQNIKNTNKTDTSISRHNKKQKLKINDLLKEQKIISIKNNAFALENYKIKNSAIQSNNKQISKFDIDIYSYNLNDDEINVLKTDNLFNYQKDILLLDEVNYVNIQYILLDKNKELNNYQMYKFLLDKKIVIDITCFLLEFVGEDCYHDKDDIIDKLKNISINTEIDSNFKTKNIGKKITQSLIKNNILSIQSNLKKNEIKNFEFIISNLLPNKEKKIILKLLKLLNGKIISKNYIVRRSLTYDNKTNKKPYNNDPLFALNLYDINNFRKKSFNSTNIKKSPNFKFYKINTNFKIIKNIYLITKDIPISFYYNHFEYCYIYIHPSYVYHSYLNGIFLDLHNNNILHKYLLL